MQAPWTRHAGSVAGPRGPLGASAVTAEGAQLAREVGESVVLNAEAKARLLAEIVNHESTHGRCTQTFMKKIRKQARPGQPNL